MAGTGKKAGNRVTLTKQGRKGWETGQRQDTEQEQGSLWLPSNAEFPAGLWWQGADWNAGLNILVPGPNGKSVKPCSFGKQQETDSSSGLNKVILKLFCEWHPLTMGNCYSERWRYELPQSHLCCKERKSCLHITQRSDLKKIYKIITTFRSSQTQN